MSVPPPPPARPTYRLVIPTVQLGVLARLDPHMRVLEAHGRGSISSDSLTEPIPFGRVVTNTVGNAYLDYTWREGPFLSIIQIYDSFLNRDIPDISLDSLCWVQDAEVYGKSTIVQMRFGKDTVHPEVYGKLVVDGWYPKQETAELIRQLKEDLQGIVSGDTLKRIRYSCLVLHRILPYPELIYDPTAIYDLADTSYMLLIKEIQRRWELFDYEYLLSP